MSTLLMNKKAREYWLRELQPPLSGFHIHTDYPDLAMASESKSMTYELNISSSFKRQTVQETDIQTWLIACYYVFLYRMSGEQDQIVGIQATDGRILPIRIHTEAGIPFSQLLSAIAERLVLSNEASLPIQEIEKLVSQSPVVQTIYGRNAAYEASRLNWYVRTEEEKWVAEITYSSHLFKESTINKFARHFQCIAQAVLDRPDIVLGDISIMTDEDVLAYEKLNDTARNWGVELTITSMLCRTVESFPDRIALSSAEWKLTYAELDRLSNQVAHALIEQGLHKGGFVAIYMERSMEAVVSMLGALKAGGTYIPLDPEHPDDRNQYIIEDTGSRIVLTKETYLSKLQPLVADNANELKLLCFDLEQFVSYPGEACHIPIDQDDIAYTIYTSGTTGRPKGVLIRHAGVVNLSMSTTMQLQFSEHDVILQYSTFSFDASVYDIFSAICCGARLHLLSNEQRYSVDSFTTAIEDTGATRIGILPTVFFNQLSAYLTVEEAVKYQLIRSFVIGGEALPGESVRNLQKKLGHQPFIVNAYGPTEITVAATTHMIMEQVSEDLTTVSIGKPIANYEVLIVNENDQLCPVNVMGELLIHSIGLAKGYLNLPDKTEEAFIIDPTDPTSGKRYYRSGDLVRLLNDGGIEYMGRKDLQVKIRGYRIEIGEIEENLAKHEKVKDVAVIVKEDDNGEKMLIGFYTSKSGEEIGKQELATFLKTKVPAYMVPGQFMMLESMPLSPTGKIDRKRLGTYDIPVQVEEDFNYVAPVTELEKEIAVAWENSLHRSRVGLYDNFFEIGGHSLKILETLVLLKPRFPKLKINDFFVYSTVHAMAERVIELMDVTEEEDSFAGSEEIRDLAEYPRMFGGNRKPSASPQNHILLTGATGYLGSSLLYQLLQTSEAVIYCLVRAKEGEEPYQRLVDVMKGYYGTEITRNMKNRVVAVRGDLEQPNLGLSPQDAALLDQHLDSIIHCGAEVKHFGSTDYFTKVNVESTDRLLDLARGKDVRFHYVSTLGIPEDLAFLGLWESFTAGSGYDAVATENVYTNSKLEAEKLVIRACEEEGVAASVYRVGNLSCYSTTGVFQKNIDNNAFYRMLKAMLLLGKAPRVHWQVDFTPVNYAGASISALALQEKSSGRLFHICNPVQISYIDMVDHLREYGYYIDLLEWRDYEAWLLDPNQPKEQAGMELAMAQLEGDGAKNSIYRFACPQTNEFLAGTSVVCHEPDREFFQRMIDYAVRIGYFPAP
ncbi:amino acid adenylation domain-containing protein [Paenibacillus motobuensis]|uniref:Non-ribosomal peptide synthetase n=1 Tax=Paenibacillus motobuensis TaxID=295324 RepID=A0ABN0YTW8_9BACL